MAGKIPQNFIDDLIARVDIVDVIDAHVPLKKKGHEYSACCPFHNEKTPSFTVSPQKQFYHCFGCGAHGTAISFLMEYEHKDFIEAINDLAHSVNMQVPTSKNDGIKSGQFNAWHEILKKAADYYQHQLGTHKGAGQARDYLKQRGLSDDIIADFNIGYAPPGWDNLIRTLGTTSELHKQLVTTGMVIEKDNKQYDRFRERIMFPILNRRGQVIGFGARALGDEQPKYLNSPETPVFHKGRELYGLYQARKALRDLPRLLVVEGYMDVVALAQFGIRYAVATLGTAATPDHLETMFRTTSEIVLCFDGDQAGRKAAWRAMEHALPVMREGRQLNVMFLPDGEDPDTLVRSEGRDAFEQRIANALPLSNFLFDNLRKQVKMNSVDGRAKLVELAKPLLTRLAPGVYRDMMIAELAQEVKMTVDKLSSHVSSRMARPGASSTPSGNKTAPSLVRMAIALLLQQPVLASKISRPERFLALELPGIDLLIALIERLLANPQLTTTAAILEHWRDRDGAHHLAKVASWQHMVPDKGVEPEFDDTINRLEKQLAQKRYQELTSQTGTLTGAEIQEMEQLLEIMHRDSIESPVS